MSIKNISSLEQLSQELEKLDINGNIGQDGLGKVKWIVPREELVSNVLDLAEKGKVLIRSPPFSGKTSLLTLIADKLKSSGEECISLNFDSIDTYQQFLDHWDMCSKIGWNEFKISNKKIFLLIDEAQYSFGQNSDLSLNSNGCSEFWKFVRANDQSTTNSLHLICAAAYAGLEEKSKYKTPIGFEHTFLFNKVKCSPEEAIQLFKKFKDETTIDIPKNLIEIFLQYTSKHFGYLSCVLTFLQKFSSLKGMDLKESENARAFVSLLFTDQILRFLKKSRGAPRFNNVNENHKKFLFSVLVDGSIDISNKDSSDRKYLQELEESFILAVNKESPQEITYVFTSAIVQRISYYYLLSNGNREIYKEDINQFLKDFASKLSSQMILRSFSFATDKEKLFEVFWQMEFYRVSTSILGSQDVISPNVGPIFGLRKFLDFYINNNKQWMIEFYLDGNKPEEHLGRFQEGGSYEKIKNKDWRVVEIAFGKTITQEQQQKLHKNLILLSFSSMFSKVNFITSKENCEFTLENSFPTQLQHLLPKYSKEVAELSEKLKKKDQAEEQFTKEKEQFVKEKEQFAKEKEQFVKKEEQFVKEKEQFAKEKEWFVKKEEQFAKKEEQLAKEKELLIQEKAQFMQEKK